MIAYKISSKIDARLVLDTFESALKNRNYPENVIFHSDRGSQYTSDEFRKRLDRASFIQSFSKKGHPYDNAVAEAFFKFLKLEETNRRSYTAFDELELSVFEYIHFYNSNVLTLRMTFYLPFNLKNFFDSFLFFCLLY